VQGRAAPPRRVAAPAAAGVESVPGNAMSQPDLELPDPLRPPPAAAEPAAGTDDLLAQMAGDEIDRLLASADLDAVAPRAREPAGSRNGLESRHRPP
jgi:hypothetical protein